MERKHRTFVNLVAPCVGAWIEMKLNEKILNHYYVAPCVGAWIEIYHELSEILSDNCRSLRGSVD